MTVSPETAGSTGPVPAGWLNAMTRSRTPSAALCTASPSATGSPAWGNIDGQSGPTITGPGGQSWQYVPAAPFKDTVSQTLAEDQENVQSFNASCDMVLGLLETLSQNDDLSFEQKNELIDRMMAVLKMKSDKDTETKRFKFAVIGAVAVLGCFLTGAVLAALGGSSQISTGEDDDPSEE